MSQRYVALLDTGVPQTFIRRNVFDRMLLVAVYTSYGLEGGTLPPRPGVGLGGLVPRTASAVLGGLMPRTESASWVGYLSPPLIPAIFAHTGHI